MGSWIWCVKPSTLRTWISSTTTQGKSSTVDSSARILWSSTPKKLRVTCSNVVHRTIPRDLRDLCAFFNCEAFLSFVWPVVQWLLALVLSFPLFFYPTRTSGDFVSTTLEVLLSLVYHGSIDRRIFHQAFRSDAVPSFHPIQMRNAHNLVSNLLDSSEKYRSHLQTLVTLLSLSCRHAAEYCVVC